MIKMILAISGTAGSGKSTFAKELAKKLKYDHFSMGDLQRELAKERGLTIRELGELEKKDPKYDHMIDEKQKKLGESRDRFVIDSWLAAKFIPNAIKIFLDGNIDVRVKRRLNQGREEEHFKGREEAKNDMLKRQKINRDRFLKFYNFDFMDMNKYDIVIDTTDLGKGEVIDRIMKGIQKLQGKL